MAGGTILKDDRRDIPGEGRRIDRLARILCRCATNRLVAPGHERAQKAECLPPGLHGILAIEPLGAGRVAARTGGWLFVANITAMTTRLLNDGCTIGPLHEPQESEVHSRAESGGAPPHSKTLARWLRRQEHPPGFGVRR